MSGAITHCRILTPSETYESGTIAFDDSGRITAVRPEAEPPAAGEVIDASGLTVVPGFIDLHVHGGGGYSLATRDREEIISYARWAVSSGLTSFLATVFATGKEESLAFVRAVGYLSDSAPDGGANILGSNLEGPFVNPRRRGALPEAWIRAPNVAELAALSSSSDRSIKLMTLAPEVPEAENLLPKALKDGIVVAIGHSDATYEEARRAFDAGTSHVTHAFNAMRPFHHRDPGIIGAAFDSPGVTVEVIADGVHLDRTTVAMLVRLFGPDRVALITDAVTPAGLEHGTFRTGEEEATLDRGRVILGNGTIAGGAATMDAIVRNVVSWQAASLADAVRMASTVPARILDRVESKGRIAPGYDADLVALDGNLDVAKTWVGGRLAYSRA